MAQFPKQTHLSGWVPKMQLGCAYACSVSCAGKARIDNMAHIGLGPHHSRVDENLTPLTPFIAAQVRPTRSLFAASPLPRKFRTEMQQLEWSRVFDALPDEIKANITGTL